MSNQTGAQMVQYLDGKSADIQQVLPEGVNIHQFMKMAMVACNDNPRLMDCNRGSVYTSIMQLCQLGMNLNPASREAHLIPYGQSCTLQIGYRGWIKLAKRSGEIKDVYADIVYENDTFSVSSGVKRDMTHEYATGQRGAPTHAYAVAIFNDGYARFEVMSWDDIERAKAASARGGKPNPAWKTWPGEMAKKTAIKRMLKTMPLGADADRAAEVENNPGVIDMEVETLESLKEVVVEGTSEVVEAVEVVEEPLTLQERLTDGFDG